MGRGAFLFRLFGPALVRPFQALRGVGPNPLGNVLRDTELGHELVEELGLQARLSW